MSPGTDSRTERGWEKKREKNSEGNEALRKTKIERGELGEKYSRDTRLGESYNADLIRREGWKPWREGPKAWSVLKGDCAARDFVNSIASPKLPSEKDIAKTNYKSKSRRASASKGSSARNMPSREAAPLKSRSDRSITSRNSSDIRDQHRQRGSPVSTLHSSVEVRPVQVDGQYAHSAAEQDIEPRDELGYGQAQDVGSVRLVKCCPNDSIENILTSRI